jgi:hypothetical protein
MLDDGVCATVSEIGEAENISKSYVSRILRLALLAPDIVEAIVAGKTDEALMLEKLERPLLKNWTSSGVWSCHRAAGRGRPAIECVPKANPPLPAQVEICRDTRLVAPEKLLPDPCTSLM